MGKDGNPNCQKATFMPKTMTNVPNIPPFPWIGMVPSSISSLTSGNGVGKRQIILLSNPEGRSFSNDIICNAESGGECRNFSGILWPPVCGLQLPCARGKTATLSQKEKIPPAGIPGCDCWT